MSQLGGAFTVEITFGGGQPLRAHYDFDLTRGEIDLRHLMAEDAAKDGLRDLLGLDKLSDHEIAEIKQRVLYEHLNGKR